MRCGAAREVLMVLSLLLSLVLAPPEAPRFGPPVRMKAGDGYVKVESPGFAAPCWHDVDKDGKGDLVVGQFNDGKLMVYRGLGNGKLAAGEWLKAEGEVAQVPGVW
jgi:hypothetical protein